MKQGTEFTAELARMYGISPQGADESESAFKDRVSGELRKMGHVIEAHEALHNQCYNEGGNMGPMGGLLGAAALALSGRDFGSTGSRQVGDEMAAGVIASQPRTNDSAADLLLAMALMMGDERR